MLCRSKNIKLNSCLASMKFAKHQSYSACFQTTSRSVYFFIHIDVRTKSHWEDHLFYSIHNVYTTTYSHISEANVLKNFDIIGCAAHLSLPAWHQTFDIESLTMTWVDVDHFYCALLLSDNSLWRWWVNRTLYHKDRLSSFVVISQLENEDNSKYIRAEIDEMESTEQEMG